MKENLSFAEYNETTKRVGEAILYNCLNNKLDRTWYDNTNPEECFTVADEKHEPATIEVSMWRTSEMRQNQRNLNYQVIDVSGDERYQKLNVDVVERWTDSEGGIFEVWHEVKTEGQALGREKTRDKRTLNEKLEKYCVETYAENLPITGTTNIPIEVKQKGKNGNYVDGWYTEIQRNRPERMKDKLDHKPTVLRRYFWFIFTCIDINGMKERIKNDALQGEQELLRTIGHYKWEGEEEKPYPLSLSFALQIPDDTLIEITERYKDEAWQKKENGELLCWLIPMEHFWNGDNVVCELPVGLPHITPSNITPLTDEKTGCTRHLIERTEEIAYVEELLVKYHSK